MKVNKTKLFNRPPLESTVPSWHTELQRVRGNDVGGGVHVDSVGVRVVIARELLRCGRLLAV